LHTIELAFDVDPFQLPGASHQVRGSRRRNQLWQKERLLNVLIDRVDADAIAWVDADVLFLNTQWVADTCRALQKLQVIQLFEDSYNLLPSGRLFLVKPSTGYCFAQRRPDFFKYSVSHPGLAWAGRRDWLRKHKLLDQNVVGGGDGLMMPGFARSSLPIQDYVSDGLLKYVRAWCNAVHSQIGGSFGALPGSVIHLYHGAPKNRLYVARVSYLKKHSFDPRSDIELDQNGLWCWTERALTQKPEMVREIAGYFAERREDETP
jgi:hypothetical protein